MPATLTIVAPAVARGVPNDVPEAMPLGETVVLVDTVTVP